MNKDNRKMIKDFFAFTMLYFCITLTDFYSIASTTNDGISDVLCLIVSQLTGAIGKTISVIALFAIGVQSINNKLEWPTALAVVLGITFIFSSNKIINWLMGQNITGC